MWKLVIVLSVMLALLPSTQTQVLGIDFGTEFWKAALISPGKNLVIVENSRSERKTLNSIAFQDGQRYFEEESKAKRLRKPQLSYFYLNKLLNSLDTQQAVEGYTFTGETYAFEDGDKEMSLEQVVGMILRNIKQHASKQAGTDIRDVVLTVPASWGFKAKMSLVNAAYLADLSVLGLINENSAAAIHYSISRNDTDPLNVMFFNLGSHNLQISIIKVFGLFDEARNKTIQSIEALSHVVAESVGGLQFDREIANHLAKQFNKKNNVNPADNVRSFTKLISKSSEVKETLSANKEIQVYIQGLMNGLDLALPISRSVIEESTIFDSFEPKIDEALKKASLSKSDINSVEMIGGASRIPKVTAILKGYFPDIEVGSHINGDESMAFGSALRAANLSLTFRVKPLHFYDPMNLDTKVVISSADKGVIQQETLFHLADHHGAKKTLQISETSDDIKITVYVGDDIVKEFVTKGLGDWKEKYVDQNITGQPTTVIEFMMSSIHIAEIKELYINVTFNVTEVKEKVEYVDEEVEVEEKPEEKSENDGEAKTEEQGEATAGENTEQAADEETEVKPDDEEAEKTEGQETEKTEAKDEAEPKKKTKTVTKTIKKLVEEYRIDKKRVVVSYEETFAKYKKFTKEETAEKKKLLQDYEQYELELKEKAKIRNDFESALYSLKNGFDEEYLKTFGKEEEIEQLKVTVAKELEWMDDNAWSATKQEFEDHFKILTGVYDPIYNRTSEYRNRQKSYNETIQYFSAVYKKTSELVTSHPWIAELAIEHLAKINSTVKAVNQKIQEQVKRELNQNPIIYNHEMIQKAESLRDEYYLLRLIPRPKKEAKKDDEATEKPAEEQTEETAKESTEETAKEPTAEQEQKSQGEDSAQEDNSGEQDAEQETPSNEQEEDL